jgi:hypothetical protein
MVKTLMQERAAKETARVINSREKKTKGQILEEAGYAPGIVKNPDQVFEAKGFQEILNKYLPDDRLAKKHEQLLEDEKSEVQIKALDMAYKVKSSYAPEKTESKVVVEESVLTKEQKQKLEEFENSLLK